MLARHSAPFHLARHLLFLLALLAAAAGAQGRGGSSPRFIRSAGGSRFAGRLVLDSAARLQWLAAQSRGAASGAVAEPAPLAPVPEGPYVEAPRPLATPPLPRPVGKQGEVHVQGASDATASIVAELGAAAHNNALSVVLDPSTASNGDVVMYTGNSFAALSTNNGVSFTYINPTVKFATPPGSAFLGHQELLYAPSIDRFVWLLHYGKNASSENRVRIAFATTAGAAAGSWSVLDVTSPSIGFSGKWLDSPSLGLSAEHLFLTCDVRNSSDTITQAICVRFGLADIADGGSLDFQGFDALGVNSLRPTQSGGTRAFFAAHLSTSSLRVYSWEDFGGPESSHDVTVPTWSSGPYNSLTGENYNWLGRTDSRITAATVVGNEVWFGWTAAAGGAHSLPNPYANIVRVDGSTFAFLGDDRSISFSQFAVAYPALSTNSAGEVGIAFSYGGGAQPYPGLAVGFLTGEDRQFLAVAMGDHGPQSQSWGDRLAVRVDGQNTRKFSAAGYVLMGGTTDSAVAPRWVRFGRRADLLGPLQPDIYEPDGIIASSKPIAVGETQFRNLHVVQDRDWVSFALFSPASIQLAASNYFDTSLIVDLLVRGPNDTYTRLFESNVNSQLLTLGPGFYAAQVSAFQPNPVPAYFLSLSATPITFALTSPNGGEQLAAGAHHTITWDSADIPGALVVLEFSGDGGASWSNIGNIEENDGSFDWTVPSSPTSQGRVRVTAFTNNVNVYDASNANFSIVTPSVTVTSPNGGETWVAGSIQTLTWNSVGVSGNVKLEYSTNAGSTWTTIAASTPNDGSENWTVPSTATAQGRVRVSSASAPTLQDQSNANFTIVLPTITVTAPNGGQNFVAGTANTITWTSTNVTGNVKLEYSTDGAGSWTTLAASTPNDGMESWTVPAVATTQARIRVSAVDGSASDSSDANFTILLPTVTVIAPNGGQTLVAGTSTNVTWSSTNVTGNVKLEYSTNGGAGWTTIVASTANDGSEVWTVPAVATMQALIRVSSVDLPVSDTSDASFTIVLPAITVTAPNGGESLVAGTTTTLLWKGANIAGNVKLEYSTDGGANWITIVASTPNDETESWIVPAVATTQARIRVSAVDVSASDSSNANFTVVLPTITLTTPNGGQTLVAGSSTNLSWTSTNVIGNVKLEFSVNAGASWTTIAADSPNDGSESWTVPAVATTQGRIRVSAVDVSASDSSDANFTIVAPTITVTAPNGGQTLVAGTTTTLLWKGANIAGNVKLEYSTNGGASWLTINHSTANDGSESWTVPATSTLQGLIRVSAEDLSASDTSDATFAIAFPTITVSAPNGGEAYLAGSVQTITWSSANVTGNVKLEYSGDAGATWTTLNASTPNDGSEAWVAPGTVTTQGRIRISAANGSASDTSNGNFSVVSSQITVTAPNGGENWATSSARAITWASTGVTGNVKLEYSADGGATWTLIAGSTANDGFQDWTAPGTPTTQGRVRVSALDGSASDASDANFTLTYSGGLLKVPAGVNFGTVKLNKTKTIGVAIENKSKTQNLIVGVAISGAPFTLTSSTVAYTIPPKKKVTVSVRFAPGAVGSYAGTLTVTSSDPANPSKAIPLTGKGK